MKPPTCNCCTATRRPAPPMSSPPPHTGCPPWSGSRPNGANGIVSQAGVMKWMMWTMLEEPASCMDRSVNRAARAAVVEVAGGSNPSRCVVGHRSWPVAIRPSGRPTPMTCRNFMHLVQQRFYDGAIAHVFSSRAATADRSSCRARSRKRYRWPWLVAPLGQHPRPCVRRLVDGPRR